MPVSRRLRAALLGPVVFAAMLPGVATADPAQPFFPPYGVDLSAQDHSVKPGDDFFAFENGAWLARTEIPADQPSISAGREEMMRVEARLRTLIEAAAKDVPMAPATTEGKVGAMYAAFMDEPRIEALGAKPILPLIAAVRNAANKAAIATMMGRANLDFGAGLFGVGIDVDLKRTQVYAVSIGQAGLGMPDRDYYLSDQFGPQRDAYRTYIRTLLGLAGWKDPVKAADAIIALETDVARASWTKAQQRDLPKLYNPMSPGRLAGLAPGFDWHAFLAGAKLGDVSRVVVNEKSAFPKLAAIYAKAPLATLKAQMAFAIADSAAPYLSAPFAEARFAFRNKALSGQPTMQPRWKRAIHAVSGGDCGVGPAECFGTLNWAVGQIYVAHDFTPETKAHVETLVHNLLSAYHTRIEHLDWMGPATKAEALKKLDTYVVKVGYPEHPRDYSGLVIRSDDLVGDVRRAAEADWSFQVKRSKGPVDRTDWIMTPQTVDAYNGSLRDIVFPAAILQAPDFDPAADDAVNYGAIGSIIGHELTHGFDDEGRTIDASGALRDWWAPADAAAFRERAGKLGAQFAQFEPVPGMHINPDLTMGENIADLGGILVALDAYHVSLGGRPAPIIDGTTGDQRFFMAYAQGWRGKAKPDAIRQQTASDPHSFRRFRVLGPLPNVDAWYDAFGVKPGDSMYRPPETRARIW